VLPWARRLVVERRGWLSPAEFNGLLGLCQFMPGPNVANLSVVLGARFQGWRGSLAALAGLFALPVLIVLLLGMLYGHYGQLPQVHAMLRGMAAVAIGLTFATGLKMARELRGQPAQILLALSAFAAIAEFRLPLAAVLFVLAPLGIALAALRDRR